MTSGPLNAFGTAELSSAFAGTITVPIDWKWKDRKGLFFLPAEMTTNHLYNTIKMVWNNFMPAEAPKIGERVNLYRFGSFYTDGYLKVAIRALVTELGTRKMDSVQYYGLRQMTLYLQMTAAQKLK